MLQGEELHAIGADGTRRAKVWLDATTRVTASWTIYDERAVKKLRFDWPRPGFSPYSYDLGGILSGGEYENSFFVAECKKYSTKNQGDHFDKFLAQSYATVLGGTQLADHIFWITWHPFRIDRWSRKTGEEEIVRAVSKYASRIFDGLKDGDDVADFIDQDLVKDLSSRFWTFVLSDRQESLVISDDDRRFLFANRR